jgi:hypothetical protein
MLFTDLTLHKDPSSPDPVRSLINLSRVIKSYDIRIVTRLPCLACQVVTLKSVSPKCLRVSVLVSISTAPLCLRQTHQRSRNFINSPITRSPRFNYRLHNNNRKVASIARFDPHILGTLVVWWTQRFEIRSLYNTVFLRTILSTTSSSPHNLHIPPSLDSAVYSRQDCAVFWFHPLTTPTSLLSPHPFKHPHKPPYPIIAPASFPSKLPRCT